MGWLPTLENCDVFISDNVLIKYCQILNMNLLYIYDEYYLIGDVLKHCLWQHTVR